MGIFSSILRGVNRPENDILNILITNLDEKYQNLLSKTGHNFYYLNSNQIHKWNIQKAEIPKNCQYLPDATLDEQLKNISFDLILCQSRALHFQILSLISIKLSCPIISVDNYLPPIEFNQFLIESLAGQKYNKSVFSSRFVAEHFGLDINDVEIVPKCVNADLFSGWIGGDNMVHTNVDYYPTRKSAGFDLCFALSKKFKINAHGYSPGFSVPFKNTKELIETYQKASIFLNTGTWLSCPMELLEAMSIGVPIISTKVCDVMDVIENGVNGFASNDPEEIITNIRTIINDKELARKIGDNGRKTIIEKYNTEIFINKWNKIFYDTIDKPCSLLKE